MQVKLTRQQELALIDIGFKALLRGLGRETSKPVAEPKKSGKKWTPEQRDKFRATMQKRYGKRFQKKLP